MQIKLYKIYDDRKKVDKDLTTTLIKTITGTLKQDCDILKPEIEVAYNDDILPCNYMYIPKFGRYYFLEPPILSTQRMFLSGSIDPLTSWASDIKKLNCVLSRQEKLFNLYLNDGNYHLLQKKQISTITFPQSFTTDGSYILTVGGTS